MPEFESVFADASQLPVADQLRLIDELAAAVPDDQPPSPSKEWVEEINRRSAEIDSGAVEIIPWKEIKQRLFKKTGIEGEA